MKKAILLFGVILCGFGIMAQSNKQTTKKRPVNTNSSKSKTNQDSRPAGSVTTNAITPAIDSFKRSNRYSPGRPYLAADSNSAATKNNTGTNSINTTNATIGGNEPSVPTNSNTIIQNNTQQNVPASPSNEPNRADINQRPINENSKNAISDMSSGQVNALNQNQMAPPPQNWGNNKPVDDKWGRNTVGESQWTPTATLSSSFSRDFPNVTGATWIRDVRDTMNYSARYKTGDYWTMSTYSATGTRIDTRTELPQNDLPRPVALYRDKQGSNNIQFKRVIKVERPSKANLYEVLLTNGRVVYVNSDGAEVSY